MSSRLHVGNLPFSVTEEDLRRLFSQVGTVSAVDLPKDRVTGRPRGFGFVQMGSSAEAEEAIRRFNGYTLEDRPLRVEIAKEREERGPRRTYPSGSQMGYGGAGRGDRFERPDRGRRPERRGRGWAA